MEIARRYFTEEEAEKKVDSFLESSIEKRAELLEASA